MKSTNGKLLYIAGPYSGDIQANIKRAEYVSICLIRCGWHVLCPHKNTQGYEQYEDEHITYQTWIDMDIDLLTRCDGVYAMLDWDTSAGATHEIWYALKNMIPIFYEEFHPCETFFRDEHYGF